MYLCSSDTNQWRMKTKRLKLTYWKGTPIRLNDNKTNSCIRARPVPMNSYGKKQKEKSIPTNAAVIANMADVRQTGSNIETTIEYTGDINKRRDAATNCRVKVGAVRVLRRDWRRLSGPILSTLPALEARVTT